MSPIVSAAATAAARHTGTNVPGKNLGLDWSKRRPQDVVRQPCQLLFRLATGLANATDQQTDPTVPPTSDNAMASGSDPYEQQLLAVFESCCDSEEVRALDSKGLARLCEKLHLEDQAPQLLERLLGRDCVSAKQITFPQFRDALLALLAGGGHKDELEGSPEREVRPKFVFGKKKYGRRSRPENSEPESEQEISGSDTDSASPGPRDTPMSFDKKPVVLDGELTPKKRKTSPERSPRTTKVEVVENGAMLGWGRELTDEEESVRATWEQLGTTHEGYLGQTELRLVCKAVGLERAADELVQQLFQRLGVEPDGRISFEQFLHLFRSGLSTGANNTDSTDHQILEEQRSLTFTEESGKGPMFLSLDTYSSGMVTAEQLLELWEAGGVSGAARLLHDLGLGSPARRPVSLAELATALEEEARTLVEESRGDSQQAAHPTTPLTAVLHASLLIHQAEAKCLKSALEQVVGERDKLRQDLAEANERASLLAQEVDDRHARLEENTQQQARLQEQRHSEEVRNLQAQLSADREQLAALTTGLELRLGQMQADETRLRAEGSALAQKCERLDKENNSLKEQLAESDDIKTQLQWKVESMPQLELRLSELEGEQSEIHYQQVLPLQEKLEALTIENTSLRDANDELTLKLEELSSKQAAKKPPVVSDDGDTPSVRNSGRRRGRPASACSEDSSDEDSPRLGKLRRCGLTHSVGEDVPDETRRLRERLAEVEQQLAMCKEQLQYRDLGVRASSQPEGSKVKKTNGDLSKVFQLMRTQILSEILEDPEVVSNHPLRTEIYTLQTRCQDLTQLQQTMEAEFEMQLQHAREERNAEVQTLKQSLNLLRDRFQSNTGSRSLENGVQSRGQLEQENLQLRENLDQVKVEIVRILSDKEACSKENSALKEAISELNTKTKPEPEQQIQQALLEGEVKMFEEAKPSAIESKLTKRVTELEASLELMREEYERCEDYWQGKLEEERRLYEQEQSATDERFTELEIKIQEYEELLCQEQNSGAGGGRLSPIEERFPLEKQVTDLEEECATLQHRLGALEEEHRLCSITQECLDAAVQTETRYRSASLLTGMTGSSLLSRDKQTQVNSSLEDLCKNSHKPPSTSKRSDSLHGDLKRLHRSPETLLRHSSLGGGGVSMSVPRMTEQSCKVKLSVMTALTGRLHLQEQRGRRLESALSQHQSHTERLVQQHREEVMALRSALQNAQARLQQNFNAFDEQAEKLVCTDMLVKELYVENALLLATVERLEQRCALLSQHAPGSA